MSNRRRNALNPSRLLIASQERTRQAKLERAELVAIINGLIEEERAFFAAIRPHVRPEGIPLLDDMVRAITPPEDAPSPILSPRKGVQVFTEEELKKVGDG